MSKVNGVQLKKTFGSTWSVRRDGVNLGWVWQGRDDRGWLCWYSKAACDMDEHASIHSTKEEAVQNVLDEINKPADAVSRMTVSDVPSMWSFGCGDR